MFSYGEFKAEDQQKMLDDLNRKVEDVYRSCIGDNEANIRLVDKPSWFYQIRPSWDISVLAYRRSSLQPRFLLLV